MNTAEMQINFLIKASSALSKIQSQETQQILRSHYLLKCSKLTGYSRLPQKHFSQETRCSQCLIEWTQKTEIKVKPIKLSKRQRRRIRCKGKLKKKPVNKEYLLHSNIMEKLCLFCNHTTKTPVIKPNESYKQTVKEKACIESPKVLQKLKKIETKPRNINKYQSNVYCESKDAFSLSKQNTLSSHTKKPKIIKNNKKKKDRFAGLCQTAVIAAAKIKQEKDKRNKLNLFLKPSI
ncbi:uncharacterized protein [Maniola hyperantus]|uniref:uncharacterized protein n=1 Tax=Aphantopus hyperantus TaxID=2795564 RepID=UPI0015681A2A|nr:uncharacterized protein LOC117993668 [Maniola hyperantus]